MGPYQLFVVFIPSLGLSRTHKNSKSMVKQEAEVLHQLNELRKQRRAEGEALPQALLEVLIEYGRRIWGYVYNALPKLKEVLETIQVKIAPPSRSLRLPSSKKERKKSVAKLLTRFDELLTSSDSLESPKGEAAIRRATSMTKNLTKRLSRVNKSSGSSSR